LITETERRKINFNFKQDISSTSLRQLNQVAATEKIVLDLSSCQEAVPIRKQKQTENMPITNRVKQSLWLVPVFSYINETTNHQKRITITIYRANYSNLELCLKIEKEMPCHQKMQKQLS
jgi:hypothetical protein